MMRPLALPLLLAACAQAPTAPCTGADTLVLRPRPGAWRVEVCGRWLCSGENDSSSDAEAKALCALFNHLDPEGTPHE